MITYESLMALSEDGELTGIIFEDMEAWAVEHGLDPSDKDTMDDFIERAFEERGWSK